jgi:hypothetical protein
MLAVKVGDVLWRMVGRNTAKGTVWTAEAKRVVKIDKNRNNAFFFADGTGSSQNSLGKTYFHTELEAEDYFIKKWPGSWTEDGYVAELPKARTSVKNVK